MVENFSEIGNLSFSRSGSVQLKVVGREILGIEVLARWSARGKLILHHTVSIAHCYSCNTRSVS